MQEIKTIKELYLVRKITK